jgi:hypothetical protein
MVFMANAYLRFTINGVRHSCWGAGVEDCKEELLEIQYAAMTGTLSYYRFRHLRPGDIVRIDYVKRRPSKSHRAELTFEITEVFAVDKYQPNHVLPRMVCKIIKPSGVRGISATERNAAFSTILNENIAILTQGAPIFKISEC